MRGSGSLRSAHLVPAALVALVALATPGRAGNGDPVDGHPTYRERAMVALTNACRQGPVAYRDLHLGTRRILKPRNYPAVPPLRAALPLDRSARAHSIDMASTPCFHHDSCDGTSLWTRIRSYRPGGTALAENIARGHGTPLEAMNGWLLDGGAADHSRGDGHRKNIMSAKYRVVGHGSAQGALGWYDTQDFGNAEPAIDAPIASGSHILAPTGRITFLASWHASDGGAPAAAVLELDGDDVLLDIAFGTVASGTWSAVLSLEDGCRDYRFRFRDATGRTWFYPESGRLFTTGEAGCEREYALED